MEVSGVSSLSTMEETVRKRTRFSWSFTERMHTVAMPMNCSGMYRGVVYENGVPKTAIFDDDELD